MANTTSAQNEIRAAVTDLLPKLRAAMDATDAARRVPQDLIEGLRAAGVYRMLAPLELGGDQVDLQTFLDVIEIVSEGNAAAGWDIATSGWNCLIATLLPVEGARRIFADTPDIAFAGGFAGAGQARQVPGGYLVSGSWHFGSGCAEADWMLGGPCVVVQASGESAAGGATESRFVCVPRAEAVLEDTWRVSGLRGTGSHDWKLQNVFVPDALTQLYPRGSSWGGALYGLSPFTVVNAVHLSAVATGIARRAIDSLIDLAGLKTPTGGQLPLRDRVNVQDAIGRAEALLESGKAYRAAIVAQVWSAAEADEPVAMFLRSRLRLAGTLATENAMRAVDLMFSVGGTTSIEDASPLSHCFRDVHAVGQNMNVLPTFYEHVGRVMLGLEAGNRLMGPLD